MKKIKLTDRQYKVLSKIARQTKMDCWFYIHQRKDGFDIVKDLENNKYISMRCGVSMLHEGIVPELLDLTSEEWSTYNSLLLQLKIKNEVSS